MNAQPIQALFAHSSKTLPLAIRDDRRWVTLHAAMIKLAIARASSVDFPEMLNILKFKLASLMRGLCLSRE